MATERQVSFAGGEFAPELWGRTDLSRYPAAARTIRNFIVTPHGVLVNRAGTQHIATVASEALEAVDARAKARVVPFVYSETDTAVLVFVDGVILVYRRSESDPRHVVEKLTSIFTEYPGNVLRDLRIAQLGNVLTVVGKEGEALPGLPQQDLQPREFVRNAADWSSVSSYGLFSPTASRSLYPAEYPVNSQGDPAIPSIPLDPANPYPSDGSGGEIEHNHPHLYVPSESLWTPPSGDSEAFVGDESHPPREWTWLVTYVLQNTDTGKVYETLGRRVQSFYVGFLNTFPSTGPHPVPARVAVYPDTPVRVGVGVKAGLRITTLPNDLVIAARVYRGREGRYGYLGETTGYFFEDEGLTPDFSDPPPGSGAETREDSRAVPFIYYEDGVFQRAEIPSVVAYFENRRYFAATPERPNGFWGSKVDDYYNHDESPLPDDADALSGSLASSRAEEIRALVPTSEGLAALTQSEEWLITGSGQNDPITPLSLWARGLGTKRGCSALEPVAVGSTIFFMEAKGVKPRALDVARRTAIDASLLSRHLFEGHTVVDWAYAEDPYSVLWVVRDDGALLSLTYVPEQEMLAWARHDLADDGLVESVCCIPEGHEDAVYLIVNRGGVRTLERMAYRLFTDIRHAIFLDRCVTYNGRNDDDSITITDHLSNGADIGDTVRVVFASNGTGRTGQVIQVDDPDGGAPVRLALGTESPASTYEAVVVSAPADGEAAKIPASLLATSITGWWRCATSITGLGHLEGKTVTVVADGNVHEGLVVNASTVDLGAQLGILGGFAIAHVGMGYLSEFESLDAIQERTRQKITKEALLELMHARGGEVGNTLAGKMVELRARQVSDAYGAITPQRREERVAISDRWKTSGTVAFRQRAPMPVTILGITREVEYGGK